jgi:hypothetical protein
MLYLKQYACSITGALMQSQRSFKVNSEVILSIQSGNEKTLDLQAHATILRICRMPNDYYQYETTINKYL